MKKYCILVELSQKNREKMHFNEAFIWKCRFYKQFLKKYYILLMKFLNVLHNKMTNHLQFTDLKYFELRPFYRHIKVLTVFRISNPDFGVFEVSDFKSGGRTGFEVSETGL